MRRVAELTCPIAINWTNQIKRVITKLSMLFSVGLYPRWAWPLQSPCPRVGSFLNAGLVREAPPMSVAGSIGLQLPMSETLHAGWATGELLGVRTLQYNAVAARCPVRYQGRTRP